ncbi:MAG: tetratricopeptide repeat protein [Spirochaetota bacterium]
MDFIKRIAFFAGAGVVIVCGLLVAYGPGDGARVALAEKEEFYTSSEEFLPPGSEPGKRDEQAEKDFMEDPTFIKNAQIEGLKLVKDKNQIVFTLKLKEETGAFLEKAPESDKPQKRTLKYEIIPINFPPRIVVRLWGVESSLSLFKFFKNMDIVGAVLNPITSSYISEYVFFFDDWVEVNSSYDRSRRQLVLGYNQVNPSFTRGYGVRIIDTGLDPLAHVIEIKRELSEYGLESYLLIASDHQTVVLESPFFKDRQQAVDYLESLANFGYKGKLAIRNYRDFPEPRRADVVSEIVITDESEVNLQNLIYTELQPQKVSPLRYFEIFLLTKDIFSQQVQDNRNLVSDYYFKLSEMYRNYDTESTEERMMAHQVAVKLLEIVYFYYPDSSRADDALWDIANIKREYNIGEVLSERECYRKIVKEYPESIFVKEANSRLESMKRLWRYYLF